VEFSKVAKSGNFVRKKSGKRSAIGEEAFVVFCLAALDMHYELPKVY